MGANKFTPGRGFFSLGGRWDVLTLQKIADCLVARHIADILQSPKNAVVFPRAILFGKLPD